MRSIETPLTKLLGVRYPIILAPMFLVSNSAMTIAAIKAGATAAIPAHNYRTDDAFRAAVKEIRANAEGPVGINLVVNKSNPAYKQQLKTCLDLGVEYIITALGSPEKVVKACKGTNIKIFCDVIDARHAAKVQEIGADALIAVNSEAGGHAGQIPPYKLIPMLKQACSMPVISAGGVGNGKQMYQKLKQGACGVSIGSPFIATPESKVADEYKQAIVDYGEKDIVMTTKISGTPCAVINTPYVQKIGTKQNWLETTLNKNKKLKKYIKMLTFYKGMKVLEKAANGATYKTVWTAGKSIEHIDDIVSVEERIKRLVDEYTIAAQNR